MASDTKTATERRAAIDTGLRSLSSVAPSAARHLASAVAPLGGRAFLVGGGVRDHLLSRPCKDFDIEVFGVGIDDLAKVLRAHGRVNAVGKSFGVLKWRPRGVAPGDDLDVSIPRRDSKVGRGHRGIAVEGDPDMPIEEAARRRDLTVNALMYDLLADELVDPYDGLTDLRRGTLRAVDRTTFLEDPLRALRVVQFAARLSFAVSDDLIELCREARLDELPAERIQGEWAKLLLKSARPSHGLAIARATQVLQRVFPAAAGLERDAVLDRAAARRDALTPEGRRWALMLLAWLGPLPTATVEDTLDRLWLHTWQGYPLRKAVLAAHRHQGAHRATDADLRRLAVHAEVGLVLGLSDAEGCPLPEAEARADALGILTEPCPRLLLGRHLKELGIPPGRHMGPLLATVYDAQLAGEVTTVEDAKALAAEHWASLA